MYSRAGVALNFVILISVEMKRGFPILLVLILKVLLNVAAQTPQQDITSEELLKMDTDALYQLGEQKEKQGSRDIALLCYLTIIEKTRGSQDNVQISKQAKALVKAGIIYFSYGDYTQSLQSFHDSHSLYQGLADQDGIANLLNNLGTVYQQWGDFDKALTYYYQANHLFDSLGMTRRLPMTFNNIGSIKIQQGHYPEALELLERSLQIHRQLGDTAITNLLSNLGVVHQHLLNYSRALEYYWEANLYAKKFQNAEHEVISLMNIAIIMRIENRFTDALNYLSEARTIAQREGFRNLLHNIYLSLSTTYDLKGDHRNALANYRLYLAENEYVFNNERHRELREIQVLHEVENKNSEIRMLKNENVMHNAQIKSQKRIMTLFGLLFIFIFLFIVAFSIQKKEQTKSFEHLSFKHKEVAEHERRNQQKIHQLGLTNTSIMEHETQLINETRNIITILEKRNNLSFSRQPHERSVFEKTKDLYFNLLKTLVPATPENHNLNNNPAHYPVSGSPLSLADFSQKKLAEMIKDIMNNEKPYLQYDFSLEKLSAIVGSNKKYVSQVINEEFGKGFNHFVNEYRIREGRKMLTNEQYRHYTFEGIANQVGFKSRSSFNSAFKMFTGLTPSFYKKTTKLALFNKKKS